MIFLLVTSHHLHWQRDALRAWKFEEHQVEAKFFSKTFANVPVVFLESQGRAAIHICHGKNPLHFCRIHTVLLRDREQEEWLVWYYAERFTLHRDWDRGDHWEKHKWVLYQFFRSWKCSRWWMNTSVFPCPGPSAVWKVLIKTIQAILPGPGAMWKVLHNPSPGPGLGPGPRVRQCEYTVTP